MCNTAYIFSFFVANVSETACICGVFVLLIFLKTLIFVVHWLHVFFFHTLYFSFS